MRGEAWLSSLKHFHRDLRLMDETGADMFMESIEEVLETADEVLESQEEV